jgi:hypothetical protein
MKPYHGLLMTAFLIAVEVVAANVTVNAQASAVVSTPEGNNVSLNSTKLMRAERKSVSALEQAHQDTLSILSTDNSCSRFFPRTAGQVLIRLISQLQIHPMRDSRIGIEMSGPFTYFEHSETKVGYRLFANATINSRGPFFQNKVSRSEPAVPRVGSFLPNTREVRVLILLHELAHLVKGSDGKWLIPDDSIAPALSLRNTELIESQCRLLILRR